MKTKKIYKILHIPTGKYVRIRLTSVGIKVWHEKGVLNGLAPGHVIAYGYGKVLYDSHEGWKTPPGPSNEEFSLINCKVICTEIIFQNKENSSSFFEEEKSKIQFAIEQLKEHIEHPNKPGYRRHDILEKIKLLENRLNLSK